MHILRILLNIIVVTTINSCYAQPEFPVATLGNCYEGIQILDDYYKGHEILYAFRSYPEPGHVWLIVDGQPIDSYYGYVNGTYWHSGQEYKTFEELDLAIQKVYPITIITDVGL